MGTSPRFWLKVLLVGALVATQTGVVAAQIPNPTDTGGTLPPNPIDAVPGPVQDAIKNVTESIDTATETVNDTVKDPVNAVDDTAGQAADTVNNATNNDPVGTVNDTAGGSTDGTANPVAGVTGAVTQTKEAGAAGTSPSSSVAGTGTASERTYSSAIAAGGLKNWAQARGWFSHAAILSGAQPSLAILVDALNDADGDGVFSDAENAAAPRADVTFKALITNIGSTNFEIAGVSHTYSGANGPAQSKVCGELVGLMLAAGESLACSFPVSDYSPARGESLVNTVMAAGFEVGKGARRGASDSDTTRVETVVTGDEVLAVAIKRNLAFTGTEAARLVALGLLFLAVGGGLISMARARSRRPTRRLPAESSAEQLGWWTAGPAKPRSKEKARIP
jgi:hypothetical protein